MGPGRSSSLRIGDDSSIVFDPGRTSGASDRLAGVAFRDVPREPPLPLDKGKGRIDKIKYSMGLEYLKSPVQNALVVGPSKVGPLYRETFARHYRPPFGVQVWSPDILTSYVVQVPKMVCFFEVAFDNGLRFPLQSFIKRVLQHFNVCPSQLSPNFWGILIGPLVFFRHKGLGVPSIALFLDLFSVKEDAEAFFIYLNVPALLLSSRISHLLINFGKSVTFLLVAAVGSTTSLTRKTHWAFLLSGSLLRIYVSFSLVKFGLVFVSYKVSLILHCLCIFQVFALISAPKMRS